jgi:endonuclease/exonuclease/phosphatase family metal-dependent hydrolase
LKSGYFFRGQQSDIVRRELDKSPFPVVICGDFNDIPNSYTYSTIKGDMQDAFLEKGAGIGRTYRNLAPTLRIDYIFVDKKFKVQQVKRVLEPYSDHYPVVADVEFSR